MLKVENILFVSADGLEISNKIRQMLVQRRLRSRADGLRWQDAHRFKLLFSHDFFKPLAGNALVGGVEGNIGDVLFFLQTVSAAIAAGGAGFAVLDAFGSENGEDHRKSAAVGGSFGFELFTIGENLGAVETGCAQDFDRLGQIAARNEAAHRPLGNVATKWAVSLKSISRSSGVEGIFIGPPGLPHALFWSFLSSFSWAIRSTFMRWASLR